MFRISKLFHNYIKFNFHVGLAVSALVQITILDFDLPFIFHINSFFFCSFLAYNLYVSPIFMEGNRQYNQVALFLIGFSAFGIFLFEGLGFYLTFLLIILFYPFVGIIILFVFLPGFRLNFRGFKGLKIHFVALSCVDYCFFTLSIYGLGMANFLGLCFSAIHFCNSGNPSF